ncbi:hypothetical protein [Gulosibacter molinativorax]|nr:hypothetical protein [Gulosibacter molinativorax]
MPSHRAQRYAERVAELRRPLAMPLRGYSGIGLAMPLRGRLPMAE